MHYALSMLCHLDIINIYMKAVTGKIKAKTILIGNPLQLNSLKKECKDKITSMIVIEADYLFSFGYE